MTDSNGKYCERPLSVWRWAITFLLMLIPVVNLGVMIAFALGAGGNKTRTNLFKILLLVTIILTILTISLLITLAEQLTYYIEVIEGYMETIADYAIQVSDYIESAIDFLGLGD